jgi:hypothetical protein
MFAAYVIANFVCNAAVDGGLDFGILFTIGACQGVA